MSEVPVPHPNVPAPPRPGGGLPSGPTASPPAGVYEREQRSQGGGPPTSGTLGGLYIPGASSMYTLLGVLLLVAGCLTLVMPYKLTDIFFRGHRKYYDVVFEELWRILAACFFAAASTCYALKVASDRRAMNDPSIQRLQLGFFWFGLLAVILHLVHLLFIKTLTFWGLLLGALVMAPTLLLPTVHLGLSGGFGLDAMWQGFRVGFGNLFAPRRASFAVIMYSLLTVLFTLAGILYVALPRQSMQWVFGYHAGARAGFLWQWIGSAMLFLFPAMTYTCLERGIEGLLWRTVPKVLNVGLLVAALFHILEFGTLIVTDGVAKRWLLPVLFVHWLLTLLASILGLAAGGEEPMPAYEYEPLHGEAQAVV